MLELLLGKRKELRKLGIRVPSPLKKLHISSELKNDPSKIPEVKYYNSKKSNFFASKIELGFGDEFGDMYFQDKEMASFFNMEPVKGSQNTEFALQDTRF